MKHLKNTLLILPVFILVMMIAGISSAYAQSTEFLNDTGDITVTQNGSYNLIDGVKEGDLTLTKSDGTTARAHVVLVKANAKASFKPMIPGYYTEGSTKASRKAKAEAWSDSDWKPAVSLSKMTAEYKKANEVPVRVLAAINGDIGKSVSGGQAPSGSVILEGNKEIARSNAETASFFFGYKDNDVLSIVQRITTQKGNFSEAICGPTYILRNGVYLDSNGEPFDIDTSSRQRTGLAYKTNGDVLIITVDTGGITVKQLAQLMAAAGCWNGVNMDGGGSTTLLTDRNNSGLTRRTANNCSGYSDEDTDNNERKISSALLLVADDSASANNVSAGNSVTTDKDTYIAGDSIKVTANTDSDGAWVSLQKYEEDGSFNVNSLSYFWYYAYGDNDAGTWSWENGAAYDICRDGECNKRDGVSTSRGLPPGNYKVSLAQYVDKSDHTKGYTLLADKDITIEEDPNPPAEYSLLTDKDAYEVGEPIMVTATAPASDGTAWVGVAEHGVPLGNGHSAYYWYYVEGSNEGSNHYNGETYDLYAQEQNSNGNVNSALIDKSRRTLLPGTFDISVYNNDSHHIAEDGDGKKVTKTITIYEKDKDYQISYKGIDSSIEGLTPASYRYSDVSAVALPSKAEVEAVVGGYSFRGWYTNSDCSGDAVTEIPKGSAGDKTFYAKLEAKTFTVSFDTDGGTEIASQQVRYLEKASKPQEEPEKDEKVFLGWVKTRNGSEPFDFNDPITGDTTVYASWGDKGYIVTFDTCGGSEVNKKTVRSGEKVSQPGNPSRPGYRFMGWVTAAGGSTRFDFNTAITDDITIYASWRALNYTITYDLNGGEAGESSANPATYNIETPTFTLKAPAREGYTFAGWKNEDGDTVEVIEKGSTGNITLTAQWKRNSSLEVDKEEYLEGQAVKVTAYCENAGSWVGLYKDGDVPGNGTDLAYYWSYVTDEDGDPVINGKEVNLLAGEYKHGDNNKPLVPGKYRVILFGDSGYTQLFSKDIIIKENSDLEGSIVLSGYSRNDKSYSGEVSSERSRTQYDYFYGDAINVKASVNGAGSEDAWVGLITDESYKNQNPTSVEGHWYYVKDEKFDGQTVNLNYVVKNEIPEEIQNLPFGQGGVNWVVLVAGSKILAAEPIFYRTFNMDWENAVWGEAAKQKMKIEPEWISKPADGEDQKPALTITRVDGHFGYKTDESGNMVEITEEVLEEGRDYTVSYPDVSKEPGTYSIKVSFPSEQPADTNNYYRYLSTSPANYGLKAGVDYYLMDSGNQHVIRYELNGGTNNSGNPGLYKTGDEVVFKDPSRTGYIFEGWYTTSDFKEGTLISGIEADADDDVTVYAKWANEFTADYKITYVLNGGTNDPRNPDGYTGNTDLSIRPASRAGYSFDGWFLDAGFTRRADVIPKGETGDKTLYAKFTKNSVSTFMITATVTGGSLLSGGGRVEKGSSYTVSYEANSGYELSGITVDGETVNVAQYPSSYTFEDVSADHTIDIVFAKVEDSPANAVVKGKTYTRLYQKYTVTKVATDKAAGEVTFTKARNKKSVVVPKTVKLADGKTYKVTAVAAYAFKASKIRTVTIGANIKTIRKYAFKKSKATRVIIKTRLLKKTKVKGALTGSKIKTVKVSVGTKKLNRTYLKKYKKIFTKKNAGRKASIK